MGGDRPSLARRTRAAVEQRVDAVTDRYPSTTIGFDLYERFRHRNGTILAGHIAYRLFVWLLPCALVLVTVAGYIDQSGGDPADTLQAGQDMALGEALTTSLRTAGAQTGSSWWRVALVALFGILLGAYGLLSGLYHAFAQIWDVPAPRIQNKGRRMAGLAAGFLLLAAILLIQRAMRQAGIVQSLFSWVLLTLMMTVILLGLGLVLPHRRAAWFWLLPGAVVGAVAFALLQEFATVYLPTKIASLSSTYGAMGVAAVFLSYLYLLGLIIVGSAFVNATWYENRVAARDDGHPHRTDRPEPSDPPEPGA